MSRAESKQVGVSPIAVNRLASACADAQRLLGSSSFGLLRSLTKPRGKQNQRHDTTFLVCGGYECRRIASRNASYAGVANPFLFTRKEWMGRSKDTSSGIRSR